MKLDSIPFPPEDHSMSPRPGSALSRQGNAASQSSDQQNDNYTISHRPPSDQSQMVNSSEEAGPSAGLQVYTRKEAREAIISSLTQILEQPLAILRNGSVSDEQMRAPSTLIPGSTLGKHLRHVHDHYRILLDSLEAQSSSDDLAVDYDKRMRIVPLETSVKDATREFQRTQERVRQLLAEHGNSSSAWQTDLHRNVRLTATTPAEVEFGSTLGREMWFVCLHSIHHFALARVILVHELGVQLDDNFGVAPSTMVLRLWRQATDERAKL